LYQDAASTGDMRNAYKILVGKPVGKGPLGRPRRTCKDIKCILRHKVGKCGLDAHGSGWRLITDSCEHGNEPLGSIKGGKCLD